MQISTDTLPKLDGEQQHAVTLPCCSRSIVVAGAGSGKTSVLTGRAAWLRLTAKNRQGTILCLSYTNKAADEIEKRLRRIMNTPQIKKRFRTIEAQHPGIRHRFWGGTLHSFAKNLIEEVTRRVVWESLPQQDRERLIDISDLFQVFVDEDGHVNRFIIDEDESEALWNQVCQNDSVLDNSFLTKWDRKKSNILSIWSSRQAAQMIDTKISEPIPHPQSVNDAHRRLWGPFDITILENHAACLFQATKLERCLVDYDDLLIMAIAALRFVPSLKQHYQDMLAHVLIDEAQDITYLDFVFLTCMPNFLADDEVKVGYTLCADGRQEIFNFRAGEPGLFLKLVDSGWPEQIAYLSTNYRCAHKIVHLSSQIAQNPVLYMNYESDPATRPHAPAMAEQGIVNWETIHNGIDPKGILDALIRESLLNEQFRSRVILVRANWQKTDLFEILREIPGAQSIELSTIHSAKGKEWDHVILTGVGHGIFPARPRFWNTHQENIRSEARLFYVAVTRAALRLDILESVNGVFQNSVRNCQLLLGQPNEY